MSDWEDIKKTILADKEVKAIYDSLETETILIESLIELRRKKKLTQSEFAKKLKTTQSAVARLEAGKANPTLHSLLRIAKAFDMDLRVEFV